MSLSPLDDLCAGSHLRLQDLRDYPYSVACDMGVSAPWLRSFSSAYEIRPPPRLFASRIA